MAGLIEQITTEQRAKAGKLKLSGGRRNRPKPAAGTIVLGSGNLPSPVMLIGEGPGDDEGIVGIPFVGASGQELDRHLERVRIYRYNCYVTNLGKVWRDGNPDPTAADIEEWGPVLEQEIAECNPAYIGTVGRHSTRYLLGDVDMERVHGIPHRLERPIPGSSLTRTVIVVPIYHPAAGMYSPELGALVQWDFEQLGKVIEGKIAARPPEDQFPSTDYRELTDDDADYVEWLIESKVDSAHLTGLGHPWLWLAVDTEGLTKRPWGGSFSLEPGTGYVFRKHSHKLIATIFACIRRHSDLVVLLHNALHDLEVLRDMELEIPEGQYIDTMVLAYLLCLEPQALKLLGYRLAGMEMSEYLEIVKDADERIADEYLARVMDLDIAHDRPSPYTVLERLGKKLTKREQLAGYHTGDMVEKTKQPHSLASRLFRILEDNEKSDGQLDFRHRWTNIDEYLRRPVELVLGEMPEPTLDDIPLSRAVGYAARDADATGRIFEPLYARIFAFGLQPTLDLDMGVFPMVEQMQSTGMRIDPAYFANLGYELSVDMARIQYDIKDATGSFINPDSGDQTSDLLFGQLGMTPIKATKTGRRPSTDDKTLEAIRHQHPVAGMVADYRERSKLKHSFCDVLPRRMDADNVVRGTIRLTRVSSGRLSMSHPNLMAIPVRTELGKKIRKGFIARPGFKFTAFDYDQVEMRVMAEQSKDPVMLDLFASGRDIHRATAAMMFRIEAALVQSFQRYAAKRVGFGVITGIAAQGLLAQMWLNGQTNWTLEMCQAAIDDWFRVYQRVEQYLHECRRDAYRYGYVREPHGGRIRYLPGIWSRLKHISAEAQRQSHSHKIQGGAQSIFKMAMKVMWDRTSQLRKAGLLRFIIQIHDSIMVEHRDDPAIEAEASHIIKSSMVEMGPTLQFEVALGAKGGSGYDWGSLEEEAAA
jgi:uracil-DNA glycosylase family 4